MLAYFGIFCSGPQGFIGLLDATIFPFAPIVHPVTGRIRTKFRGGTVVEQPKDVDDGVTLDVILERAPDYFSDWLVRLKPLLTFQVFSVEPLPLICFAESCKHFCGPASPCESTAVNMSTHRGHSGSWRSVMKSCPHLL